MLDHRVGLSVSHMFGNRANFGVDHTVDHIW